MVSFQWVMFFGGLRWVVSNIPTMKKRTYSVNELYFLFLEKKPLMHVFSPKSKLKINHFCLDCRCHDLFLLSLNAAIRGIYRRRSATWQVPSSFLGFCGPYLLLRSEEIFFRKGEREKKERCVLDMLLSTGHFWEKLPASEHMKWTVQ